MKLPWQKEASLEEIQTEDDRKGAELSLEQKRLLLARLKQERMTIEKSFGGSWAAAWRWLKSH
jgi:hypothetical protein